MVDEPNPGLWGVPSPTQSGLPGGTYYSATNGVGGTVGYGAPSTPAAAATPASSAGDFSLDSLKLSADGHLWGEKRVISADPNNPGSTRYQFVQVDLGDSTTPEGIAAISAATGIPAGAITAALPGLQAQLAQNARAGNGSIIGQNPDGSFSYYDRTGTIKTTTDESELAAVGIQPSAILQAKNDLLTGQRTQTQAKQFTIVGANPNGTISVRDYYGNVTSIKPNADGTLSSPTSGQPIPGISAGEVQQALLTANENRFQSQTVGQNLFSLPGGTPPPAPPAPPPGPNPTPPGRIDPTTVLPGTPAPTPGGTPPTGAPPPSGAPDGETDTGTTAPPAMTGTGTTGWGANPAAAAATGAYSAPPPQYPASGVQTPPTTPVTPATGSSPGLATPPAGVNRSATSSTATTPTTTPTRGADPMARLNAQYQAAAAAYAPAAASTPGSTPGGRGTGGTTTPTTPAATGPAPTGGVNDWTTQQLSLMNQAKQNYLNYGKAAQATATAALANQSRSTQGTGFSSINQRQTLAGQ